ncbi:SgcJ/EcaC family oxidoreductase [Streptomyces sp. 4F14]|uniref:SgcJ/EcaC family oxidoreductase n=1 Tax=Streptomyces sp. 4F14 TaxID=3394380 RepID=UPI003A8919C5
MDTNTTDTNTAAANTTVTEAADVAAIERVVAEVERTQRAEDVEGFLALFHPEALWTTGHGKVLIGRDTIAEFTRSVLPGSSGGGEVSYRPVHIQFLRPDVAAVKVRQVYRTAEGDSEGAPLYVMTRRDDGAWLLHACQNTGVQAD